MLCFLPFFLGGGGITEKENWKKERNGEGAEVATFQVFNLVAFIALVARGFRRVSNPKLIKRGNLRHPAGKQHLVGGSAWQFSKAMDGGIYIHSLLHSLKAYSVIPSCLS